MDGYIRLYIRDHTAADPLNICVCRGRIKKSTAGRPYDRKHTISHKTHDADRLALRNSCDDEVATSPCNTFLLTFIAAVSQCRDDIIALGASPCTITRI